MLPRKMLTAYSSTGMKFILLFVPFLSLHYMFRLMDKCIFMALELMKTIGQCLVIC